MAPQSEHKFPNACTFRNDYSGMSCDTGSLQPIAKAFIRNMNRVRGIGMFPVTAVAIATVNEAARIDAVINKGLSIHDTRLTVNGPDFDRALFKDVDEERLRLVAQWMKNAPSDVDARFFMVGTIGVNTIIDWNPHWANEAVQASMAAMLIGLWTAFESLAQDAWITAVNSCPVPLAANIMAAPDSALRTGNQSKSINYSHFIGSNFDFRSTMGTLLFNEKKVDFQSLKDTRLAYKTAFSGELERIFDQYQTELFRLETVRNLFAHKGGIIDRKFLDRMGEDVGDQKIGDSLVLNGEYVAEKANIVVFCSNNLLDAVDKWLSANLPNPNPASPAS
jgi:hypothetical protein